MRVEGNQAGDIAVDPSLLPPGITLIARGRKLVAIFELDIHNPVTCDPASVILLVSDKLTRQAKRATREALGIARENFARIESA